MSDEEQFLMTVHNCICSVRREKFLFKYHPQTNKRSNEIRKIHRSNL